MSFLRRAAGHRPQTSSSRQRTRVPAAAARLDNSCRSTSTSIFAAVHLHAWPCHFSLGMSHQTRTRPLCAHGSPLCSWTATSKRRSTRLLIVYQGSRQRASLRVATRERALLLPQRFERCVGRKRRKRGSRSSDWTDGERRCIGSACPTRCARAAACSGRSRSRFEEMLVMPRGLMGMKMRQEGLVFESGTDGGDY